MIYEYEPQGVCSFKMIFDIENDVINSLRIIGGCPGNTVGVAKLVEGKNIDEVISLLQGIPCRERSTSCPDQVAKALVKFKQNKVNA